MILHTAGFRTCCWTSKTSSKLWSSAWTIFGWATFWDSTVVYDSCLLFWQTRAPVETQKGISVFYSIMAHNYRYYIPLKKHCEGSNIVPNYSFEILLFSLRVSQSGFGQDYDIGKFCLKPTLCNYVQHLLLAFSHIFVNRVHGILIL